MYTVAVIDDERHVLSGIRHTFPFKFHGFLLIAALSDPYQALSILPNLHPDVVIVDVCMPKMSGMDLLHHLKASLPNCVFLLLSCYSEIEHVQRLIQPPVFGCLCKPFDEKDIVPLLEHLSIHLAHLKEQSQRTQKVQIPSVHSNQQFNKLLFYLDHHVYEPLNLEELAADFFLSPNYCSQLFKIATGKTFSNYVRSKRIVRAKELLEKSALSITDVAAAVGYNDIHYFTRVFSAQVGMPPRKYRIECKNGHTS